MSCSPIPKATPSERKRRPLRYTLRFLLLLMLIVGALLATHQIGFRRGYRTGRNAVASERIYTSVYQVADLLTPDAQSSGMGRFEAEFMQDVLPETWEANGGFAAVASFDTNLSLVVSHNSAGHKAIEAYLSKRRSQRLAASSPQN